jgi:hypothetical protein
MNLTLGDLGQDFEVKALNQGNSYRTVAQHGRFMISPGTYLLVRKGKKDVQWTGDKTVGNLYLNEFVAPQAFSHDPYLAHTPLKEVSAGKPFVIKAKLINIDSADKVNLVITNKGWGPPAMILMKRITPYHYIAEVPATQVTTGELSYRIIIQHGAGDYYVFPGDHKGNPYTWDYINNDYYRTFVAAPNGSIALFDATADQGITNAYYPVFTRNGGTQFVSGSTTGQLVFRASSPGLKKDQVMGLQLFIWDKLKGRASESSFFNKLVVRARVQNGSPFQLRVALINSDASSYAAYVELSNEFKDIEIPLSTFKPDSSLLLPRPYPDFQPLWFKAARFSGLNLSQADKLEVTIGNRSDPALINQPLGVEIESVRLEY